MTSIHLAVLAKLNESGLECTYEYPGYIQCGIWSIGDVNDTWDMQEITEDGQQGKTIDLGISCTSDDVPAIAQAILNALHNLDISAEDNQTGSAP